MIIEPPRLLPGRPETSEPDLLRTTPDAADGHAFGRTLSDALRADRADRSTNRRRWETVSDDDRGPGTDARPADRPETDSVRVDRRAGDDDPAATNENADDRKPAAGNSADDREASDHDRPTGSDPQTGSDRRRHAAGDTEAADGHKAPQTDASQVDGVIGTNPAPGGLDIDTADDSGITGQVTGAESASDAGTTESGPSTAAAPVDAATTPVADTVDGLLAGPADTVEGGPVPRPTGTTTTTNDASGVDSTVELDQAGLADRQSSTVGPVASSGEVAADADVTTEAVAAETEVLLESGARESAQAASAAVATTTASTGGRTASVPDVETTGVSATPSSSIPVADAGSAVPGQPTTAGEPQTDGDSSIEYRTPSPDAADLVDESGAQPEAGGDETAVQSPSLRNDRPVWGLPPAASPRAPSSIPSQTPATAAGDPSPAPNLVELQTAGLAERLRPAFAAVRRGVNGLDELRLRIQDDNAGPIKVDIATIDNRIRVLLSAGSDDLMRQLGQERDRLADELRRAGFDQASIDIESDGKGRWNGSSDTEESDRPGSGDVSSTAPGAAAGGSIEPASTQRERGLTGLDLDL